MNTCFRILAHLLVLCILAIEVAPSQLRGPGRTQAPYSDLLVTQPATIHQPMVKNDSTPSFYKRKAEWKKIIDAYWGPGDPYTTKLSVFDAYVSYVRANFPAFVYSKLNWDSVAAYWRMKITDSTSRGAFAAILGKLGYALNEWHAGAFDNVVEAMPLTPGTPGATLLSHDVRHFGAALTPLPDKSLLVYKVIANHPLGLERGDRVLGYEGVLWPQLLDELLEAGVGTDFLVGGCPTTKEYYRLAYAGMCWHLFDTIDVVKYSSGQIIHLPTAPLASLDVSAPLLHCDQMPIPGVPMPSEDLLTDDVTYGIVQRTNIGYIYVRHHMDPKITPQFDAAVRALANAEGLIIDLRLDYGGRYGLEQGIARLVNFGDSTLEAFRRYSISDLQRMIPATVLDWAIPLDAGTMYDRPIAVLVGPQCRSYGDISAYEFSYIPGARFFGKSPTGAYSGYWWNADGPTVSGYTLVCPNFTLADHRFSDIQLWNKEFPVDEEVWLTPESVAIGEDDVVKHALQWMNTLSYAHDIHLTHPSRDTLRITARVQNPQGHTLKVTAILKDGAGALIDSLSLKDDGHHGDGAAGDSLWGYMYVPSGDASLHATVRTDDMTTGTSRILPDAATILFTHGALIAVDTRPVDLGPLRITTRYDTTFVVRNIGYAGDSLTVSIDPVAVPDTTVSAFPKMFALAPGDSQKVTFSIRLSLLAPAYYYAQVIVESKNSGGQKTFTKNYAFQVVATSVADLTGLPAAYVIEQNFPNPFNPSTTIRYGLPNRSHVTLTVFNTLGQQVAQLVNDEVEAGYHEVHFDGSKFASGVYLYRMVAGTYVETRRLLLVR